MIWMRHPDFPDREPVLVELRAYNHVWKEKGWVPLDGQVDIEDVEPASALLGEMSQKQLVDIAEAHGIEVKKGAPKKTLIEAILAAPSYYTAAATAPDPSQSPAE